MASPDASSRVQGAAGVDHGVSRRDAARVWALVAANSFGGPAGQIAVMHRFLVEERRWISEQRFLHALSYCMVLPGPEAQQLATYIGWLMHGPLGGLVAGVLFVLPGIVAIFALSVVYALVGDVSAVSGFLFGLQAAVVAIVVEAVIRIGRRAVKSRVHLAIAVAAFVGIFFFAVPFPVIVLSAGVLGAALSHLRPAAIPPPEELTDALISDENGGIDSAAGRSALRAAGIALALWAIPVVVLLSAVGPSHVFAQEATFFSKSAVLTFGGAYAVLAYVAQAAVTGFGWLQPGEMLTGLGMAETTPGPLIMVVQFVGFMAAYRDPGSLSPLAAAAVGSAITVWVTFAPCFFFIFAGAPFIERLRGNHALGSALAGVTAAIVGVILNLAVWFALHTAFERVSDIRVGVLRLTVPAPESVDVAAVGILALAMILLFRVGLGIPRTLLLCAAVGMVLAFAIGT